MPGSVAVSNAPTIFSSLFLPGNYLICADSLGQAHVWGISELLEAEYWDNAIKGHKPLPSFTHRLHECPIYSIALVGDKVLLTGGDDCIKAWDMASLCTSEPKLLSSVVNPQQTLSRGAVTPVAETNGLAVNRAGTLFYSAAGDGKAYEWDVSTMTNTGQFEGHKGYLHCIARHGHTGIVTGSEDGTVRLWDARSRQGEELVPSGASKGWVGAVDADEGGNWVVGGGGARCMYLWHIGSRKVAAAMPTCGTVQAVTFCDDNIVSAGAERAIYRWRCNGKLQSGCLELTYVGKLQSHTHDIGISIFPGTHDAAIAKLSLPRHSRGGRRCVLLLPFRS